jgi:hypothetical protein
MKPSSCISYYPWVPNLPGMKDTEMERDMECLLGELTDNTSKMKFHRGGGISSSFSYREDGEQETMQKCAVMGVRRRQQFSIKGTEKQKEKEQSREERKRPIPVPTRIGNAIQI